MLCAWARVKMPNSVDPVAGKTGTSEDYRDLWFIGYIPQVVTGVWMGNDDNHPTKGTSALAAQTWQTYMAKITQGMPVKAFPNVPRLTGRKGNIKAQPIQPKQMLTESIPSKQNPEEDRKMRVEIHNFRTLAS